MIEKSEFDVAYETLEEIRPDLLNLKMTIDNNLRGLSRMAYKKLKLKDY